MPTWTDDFSRADSADLGKRTIDADLPGNYWVDNYFNSLSAPDLASIQSNKAYFTAPANPYAQIAGAKAPIACVVDTHVVVDVSFDTLAVSPTLVTTGYGVGLIAKGDSRSGFITMNVQHGYTAGAGYQYYIICVLNNVFSSESTFLTQTFPHLSPPSSPISVNLDFVSSGSLHTATFTFGDPGITDRTLTLDNGNTYLGTLCGMMTGFYAGDGFSGRIARFDDFNAEIFASGGGTHTDGSGPIDVPGELSLPAFDLPPYSLILPGDPAAPYATYKGMRQAINIINNLGLRP